jgi:hypothetical protein
MRPRRNNIEETQVVAQAEWDDWGAGVVVFSFIFNAILAALLASLVLAALIAVFGCFNIGLAYGLGPLQWRG